MGKCIIAQGKAPISSESVEGNKNVEKWGCRTKQLVRSLFSMKKIQPGFEKSGCWCKI